MSVCLRACEQSTSYAKTVHNNVNFFAEPYWAFSRGRTYKFPSDLMLYFTLLIFKVYKKKPILKIMTAFERVTLPAASSDNVTMASHSHPIPIYTISFTQAAVKIPKTENDITM